MTTRTITLISVGAVCFIVLLIGAGIGTGMIRPQRSKVVTKMVASRSHQELAPPGVTEMSPADYFVKSDFLQNAWHLCEVADKHGGGIDRMRRVRGGVWIECHYANDYDRFDRPKNLAIHPQVGR